MRKREVEKEDEKERVSWREVDSSAPPWFFPMPFLCFPTLFSSQGYNHITSLHQVPDL